MAELYASGSKAIHLARSAEEDFTMQADGCRPHGCEVWEGVVAGVIAGAVGTWAMTQFQTFWSQVATRQSDRASKEEQGGGEKREPATVKAAAAISERLFQHPLTEQEKKAAGPLMHYGFGSAVGGLYGALATVAPEVKSGAGLPFGAALWRRRTRWRCRHSDFPGPRRRCRRPPTSMRWYRTWSTV